MRASESLRWSENQSSPLAYERYFEVDGKIYHILDPKTGYPLDNEILSVTVISDNSIDGDIYTTLLYGMGVKLLSYLTTIPHIEAILRLKRVRLFSRRNANSDLHCWMRAIIWHEQVSYRPSTLAAYN